MMLPSQFLDFVGSFAGFGQATQVERVEDILYYTNEFWTAGQRRAHALHEISYRACFKPQLPGFFINMLSSPGEVVFDPFMGRGTTPIQAALMSRKGSGNDISPLSRFLARPRLHGISLSEIEDALHSIPWASGEITREDLLVFYHPKTLKMIEALKSWVASHAGPHTKSTHAVADWIRMVALSRLSGHSPGFFSVRSMPPNQAVSLQSQARINTRLNQSPPERDVPGIIMAKTRALLRDGPPPDAGRPALFTGPAWSVPEVADASVALVVTSPPFLDVVQYAADNWLRCWFAGIAPAEVPIDMHRDEVTWREMIRRVLREMARIVKPGGYVALEVGEVRSGKLLLERLVWQAAEGLPLERVAVVVNSQHFTKTANCWGVSNGARGTNTNRIVILRRP